MIPIWVNGVYSYANSYGAPPLLISYECIKQHDLKKLTKGYPIFELLNYSHASHSLTMNYSYPDNTDFDYIELTIRIETKKWFLQSEHYLELEVSCDSTVLYKFYDGFFIIQIRNKKSAHPMCDLKLTRKKSVSSSMYLIKAFDSRKNPIAVINENSLTQNNAQNPKEYFADTLRSIEAYFDEVSSLDGWKTLSCLNTMKMNYSVLTGLENKLRWN